MKNVSRVFKRNLLLLTIGITHILSASAQAPVIYQSNTQQKLVILAGKELQRYLYILTGSLPPIHPSNAPQPLPHYAIGLAIDTQLTQQQYKFQHPHPDNLLITGGSDLAVLYGAYDFLERMGIGFSLYDDILPDKKISHISFSQIPNQTFTPSFALRGIQPFHDFPEGPDWWNEDDYKQILTQLVKLRMNFFGLHSYPEAHPTVEEDPSKPNAEPTVWVGTRNEFNPGGTVKSASPVGHFTTGERSCCYLPEKTAAFCMGSDQLFEADGYGPDYMLHITPWPHSQQDNIEISNKVGELFNHAFSFAGDLGIKTAIGTQTPLTIPDAVKQQLKSSGIDPESDSAKRSIYAAMFARIMATHRLDYYWLWTSEEWRGEKELDTTEKDLYLAIQAARQVNAPFTLGTSGWALGPANDPTAFDRLLPKRMPMATINGKVGFAPVDPAFRQIKHRPTWEITWLEDDPALVTPQCWAGRVMKDAADAYHYGCNGFMGIHWRTQELSPAIFALKQAGWAAKSYDSNLTTDGRDYPALDLYTAWAACEFGPHAASAFGAFFNRLDGILPGSSPDSPQAKFPRSADWDRGPGTLNKNKTPWPQVARQYAFVDSFESMKSLITGPVARRRFEYWLNLFRYAREQGHVSCLLGLMESQGDSLANLHDKTKQTAILQRMFAIRTQTVQVWQRMVGFLLETVNTTGAMGTLTNLETHNLGLLHLFNQQDSIIQAITGQAPPPMRLSNHYPNAPRMVVTTRRTLLQKGEDFKSRIRILAAASIDTPICYYKPLAGNTWSKKSLIHLARNVYELKIPSNNLNNAGFEYYIETHTAGKTLRFPADPSNQTVVIW